jgi:hypothetical protein
MRIASVMVLGLAIALLSACDAAQEASLQQLGTASGCDAAVQTCQLNRHGISLTLALGPEVKPLVPFPLQLRIEAGGRTVQNVIVDFQMQGMDMGMNRYRLQPGTGAFWHGNATLPVCTAARMDWLAQIEFNLDGQPYRAVFPFHTEAN